MPRKLSLKKDVVSELTVDELSGIAAGAATVRECIDLSLAKACGLPPIPTCGYTCTNTSTVFKG